MSALFHKLIIKRSSFLSTEFQTWNRSYIKNSLFSWQMKRSTVLRGKLWEGYAAECEWPRNQEGLVSLFGNVSLRGRSLSGRRARSSRTRLFVLRCHRCLGQPYPSRTQLTSEWTSKKPNPVYQPTDPPSPLLVTYSVTADDQDDFDSPLVLLHERQRCIKVMIRRIVKEENVKILISRYSRTKHRASWLPVSFQTTLCQLSLSVYTRT